VIRQAVLETETRCQLIGVLRGAQEQGFVGPGAVEFHVEHAEALAAVVGAEFSGRFLDLGSGAGVPGMILAVAWPDATGTLVDSRRRRCQFMEDALGELGLSERVRVECGRAEELARRPDLRGAYDLVVARGFGPPAVTAECAVGFLAPGGRLVVSEPPGEPGRRWPGAGLAQLGFRGPEVRGELGTRFAMITLPEPASERWPRRVGVPSKRPLWV
jgi:16S rRNA (guanine527-N7)-methyltransferase